MSSYIFTAINKKTGEEIEVFAHDDYFGDYEYGYRLPDGSVLQEEVFWNQYERK